MLIAFLLMLGAGSLIYNNYLVGKILKQERISVELWAKAIEYNALPVHQQASTKLIELAGTLMQMETVPDSIVQQLIEIENLRSSRDFVTDELILDESRNFEIPAVVVDENDVPLEYAYLSNEANADEEISVEYGFKNVPPNKIDTPEKRARLVDKLKATNPPIEIIIGDENTQISQFVYYGESPTVQILRYFPYIQIGILTLLLGVGYTTYRSIKQTEQSNLWVGMAKEAAHQLGTPISSLYGWIALYKEDHKEDEEGLKLIEEIENDVQRLRGVAERFGKIGSSPELKPMSIAPVMDEVTAYMERRLPQLGRAASVDRKLVATGNVALNPELFQWAVENLVKNAMDAVKSKDKPARIRIRSSEKEQQVVIDIIDNGCGIETKNFKHVFRPGYSTKKRGWGLGLSLTKRIIEDYHNGKVFVHKSEEGQGTTMRITLPIANG